MLVSELIDKFQSDYKIQCFIKKAEEINLPKKYLASMLSTTVSDLQKRLGIIEASLNLVSQSGVDSYNISASFMNPKVVLYSGVNLDKVSPSWIESRYPQTGTPTAYAIKYNGATAQLILYPAPGNGNDTISMVANYNYNLYSPSGLTAQDFGSFDGNSFSGSTVFPTQYDQALILGMLMQVFDKRKYPEFTADYEKEVMLLKVLQFNGEKFEYHFDDGIEAEEINNMTDASGSITLDLDLAWKELRVEAVSGSQPQIQYSRGWIYPVTITDNGTTIKLISNGEFDPNMIITLSQPGMNYTWISASEIDIASGSNYGTLAIKLEVY